MPPVGASLWGPAPISAHPSHVSCPPGSSTDAPSGCFAMGSRAHFGTPLTRFLPPRELHRCPQWVLRYGVPRPFRHTPHTFPAPQGAPPMPPVGASLWGPAPISAHPSHVSCPPGSSTDAPSGCVAMGSRAHFGTPLTRF